jgi:hypothetical protein
MSPLVKQLIGSFVEPVPPLHPLAKVVESQLKQLNAVQWFLESLPEKPDIETLHVTSLTENRAECFCPVKIQDHESPIFFRTEVRFVVDLATSRCSVL